MNLGDDSAYLPAGTEVSAKFKGAFCEAKIKKVEKCVKCKITLKQSNEQLTVSDECIRSAQGHPLPPGEFKSGNLVHYCKNLGQLPSDLSELTTETAASLLAPATLNKCTDQSLYTVIFNDGDEKTTRRSFIRFKGTGKPPPAMASSTLLGGSSFVSGLLATASTSYKSEDENDDQSVHEDHERATLRSGQGAAKQPPAAPGSASTSKQTADLNDLLNNEEEEAAAAGAGGHHDDEDSSDSEDYPSEEKDRFVAQLYKFMDDRGTPMNKIPSIQNVDLDLHKFFIVVKRYGGFNKVNKNRNWYDIYRRLSLPNINAAGNILNLKSAYKRYLQPYEDFYRKLGSNFCDFPSLRNAVSNSSKRHTDRSLQLFKNRVITTPNTVAAKKPVTAKVKQPPTGQAAAPSAGQQKQQNSCPTLGSSSHLSAKEVTSGLLDTTPKMADAMKRSSSATGTNLNEDILSADDFKDQAPTLGSIVAEGLNSLTPTRLTTADDQQPAPEEITLSSMFRNIAEESKKAKAKEKKKYGDEDSGDMPSPSSGRDEPVVKPTVSSSKTTTQASTAITPASTAGSSKSGAKARRGSVDVAVTAAQTKPVQKISLFGTTERLSTRSDMVVDLKGDDYDDESDMTTAAAADDSNAKRSKVNRTSQSNDDSQLKNSVKRKSTGDGSGGPSSKIANLTGESASGESSINDGDDMTVKSEPDTQESTVSYKTPLTIHDLEVNRLVDVKYGHGNQKSLYEAKIVQINLDNNTILVHYLGWNNRYDEWVKLDKIIRMRQDDNKRRKGTIRPFQPVVLPKTPKTTTTTSTAPPKTPAASDTGLTKALKTPESEVDETGKTGLRVGGGLSKPPGEQDGDGDQRSMSTVSSVTSETPVVKEDEPQELVAGKTGGEVKLTGAKSRDSTSSTSSASLARQSSSEEVKLETAPPAKASPRDASKQAVIVETSGQAPTVTGKSDVTASDLLTTPLHSIKEEIMEFETSITPATLSGSGHASPAHGSSAINSQVDALLKENKINSRSSSISSGGGDVSTSHSLKEFTIGSSTTPAAAVVSCSTPPAAVVSSEIPPLAASSSRTASPSRPSLPPSIENKATSKPAPAAGKGSAKATAKTTVKDGSPLTTTNTTIDTVSVDPMASHISNVSSPASSTSSSTRLKGQTEPVLIDTTTELGVGKSQNSPSLCSVASDYSDSNSSPKKAYKSVSNSDLHIPEVHSKAAAVASPLSASNQKPEIDSSSDQTTGAKKKPSSRSVSTDEERKSKSDESSRKENESSSSTNNSKPGLEDSISNLGKKPITTTTTQTSQSEQNSKYSFHVISPNLQGKQRIRFIEEQMRLCRDAYSKLKNEIANIDRKKKKLKRNDETTGNATTTTTAPMNTTNTTTGPSSTAMSGGGLLTNAKKSMVAEVK